MKKTQDNSTNTLIEGGSSEITNQNSGEIMNIKETTETLTTENGSLSAKNNNIGENIMNNSATATTQTETDPEITEAVNLPELTEAELAVLAEGELSTADRALIAKSISEKQAVKFPIKKIKINREGRRSLNEDGVIDIKMSFGSIGQIYHIIVDKEGNLVAGWHRIQAAIELDWTEITAVFVDSNIDKNELIKIDENVCRAVLSEFQMCEYLYKKHITHRKLNPEAYASGNQYTKKAEAILFNAKHVEKMMTELGISRSTYYEKLGYASSVSPEAKDELRRLDATKDSVLYKDLAKLTPKQQLELVNMNYDYDTFKEEVAKLATPAKDADAVAKSANTEKKKAVKILEFNDSKNEIIAKIKNYGIVLSCDEQDNKNVIRHGNVMIKTCGSKEYADAFLEGCLRALELSKAPKVKAV